MSFQTNSDNIYQVGTLILAKADPRFALMIRKYYQRIYYCAPEGNENVKQLAYFEKELLAPANVESVPDIDNTTKDVHKIRRPNQ